ncbi:hypothetical protein [Nonomuraea maritima]|uniref:hypothetical protein n=1 Tax=Nonomuraea maritima TaxID=683260 RepID=UPI003719D767
MERARQLVGEMLVYCFAIVLITGAYLTFFYNPDGGTAPYSGSYTPLHGVEMSGAYESVLRLSMESPSGLLARQTHYRFSTLLVIGAVIWALLGLFRYLPALLGLGLALLSGLAGFGAVDDLLSGTVLGRIPVLAWYVLHLLTSLTMAAVLVVSARQEAARRPRTPEFVVLTLALTALVFFWR